MSAAVVFPDGSWKAYPEARAAVLADIAFAADNGLGLLMRDGQPVFYSWPVGGPYREAVDPRSLVAAPSK